MAMLFAMMMVLILLSACGGEDSDAPRFEARRNGTLFSLDGSVLVEYEIDLDGVLIHLDIDRLLTLEEMFLYHPAIDYDPVIEGFDGPVFTTPSPQCTAISNEVRIPINLEIGNTRYRYDDTQCRYRTIDFNNEFRAGRSTEYRLTDYIQERRSTNVRIIVYVPDALVSFVDLDVIPHTAERMGIYYLGIGVSDESLAQSWRNYYNDTSVYEQLYLTHQGHTETMAVINGVSEDLNLLDLANYEEPTPLIADFETRYALEIQAILELQQDIGIAFEESEENTEESPDTEEDPT
jgi:hypothetical protein